MLVYVLRRILSTIPVGIGVVTLVALLIHTVPGDPVDTILGDYATLEDKAEMRHQLGLDRPVLQQLLGYLKGLAHGDLGNSLIHHAPVTELIVQRLRPTMELAFAAMLVATLLSLPLGIIGAVKKGKALDGLTMTFSLLGIAVPTFWLGPMLVLIFSLKLGWLPVSERTTFSSYILPSLTLGTALASILSRMTRNSMLDCLGEDYVRTARAKGVRESKIILAHVLRNAALPMITILGMQFGVLLTGAIITEKVFDWPGIGSLIIEGLANRDYPVVQGCVLLFSIIYLSTNLATDLIYALIDPRIKLNGSPT